MRRESAGLILYRFHENRLQVLLVHPGGPYFKNRDQGAWSIPKGEVEPGEELLETARREFAEETGVISAGPWIPLKPVVMNGGKIVHAWAFEGDYDLEVPCSNVFTLEWPPQSGRQQQFPEIDRAEFFDVDEAIQKIHMGQVGLIDQLRTLVANKR